MRMAVVFLRVFDDLIAEGMWKVGAGKFCQVLDNAS
jgi:hypothetical protein